MVSIGVSIIISIPHCYTDKVWVVKMVSIGVSIIISIPHCYTDKVLVVKMVNIGVSIIISIPLCPIDYFIPFCCLDDILTPRILSTGQCGILTMIDTLILAIFIRKKVFSRKMWKCLYIARALSVRQCGILMMIDTPISIFFSKTAWPIKAKFHMESQWDGGTKACSRGLGHMTKMATMPIYGKNTSKITSRTKGPMTLWLGTCM